MQKKGGVVMIEGADFYVRIVPFPVGVGSNGMLLLNDDGTYSVYLNSRAPAEKQKSAMWHEYAHMANDDMYGDKDIKSCEANL